MPLILSGNVGSATAATSFNVANSVRFNRGDSAYMHKTPSSAGNVDVWTFSAWIKVAETGGHRNIFAQKGGDGTSQRAYILLNSSGQLYISQYTGSATNFQLVPNRLLRDESAWYHIVVAVDTTQGTDTNRLKLYINGVQETSFETSNYPSQNLDTYVNAANQPMAVGYDPKVSSRHFGGYMAEVVLIDGQQLAPDQFGEFDSDSGIWKPINVSGLTAGTNGFYLDFEDSSNLGNDVFGGTDLTEVNLAATDQSTDTCTNNFATFNSLTEFSGNGMAEGNLKFTNSTSTYSMRHSTFALTKGKWYAEFKITQMSGGFTIVGIQDTSQFDYDNFLTSASRGYGYRKDGTKGNNNSTSSFGNTFDTGDIIGVAMDLDNNKLYFSKNGTFQNSSDPTSGATGTGSAFDIADGYDYCIGASSNDAGTDQIIEANYGSPPFAISSGNTDGDGYGNFEYAVPSGYFSLNTKNLAEYG